MKLIHVIPIVASLLIPSAAFAESSAKPQKEHTASTHKSASSHAKPSKSKTAKAKPKPHKASKSAKAKPASKKSSTPAKHE